MRFKLQEKHIEIIKKFLLDDKLYIQDGIKCRYEQFCMDARKNHHCVLKHSYLNDCRLEDGEPELKENFPEYYL